MMDLRSREGLWKTLAIRVANLFVFYILVFVMMIDYTLPIWILIVIESTCYLVIVFMIIAAIFVNSCVSVDLVPDITERVLL